MVGRSPLVFCLEAGGVLPRCLCLEDGRAPASLILAVRRNLTQKLSPLEEFRDDSPWETMLRKRGNLRSTDFRDRKESNR